MANRRNLRVIREINSIEAPINWTDPSVGGFRLDNSTVDAGSDATPTIIFGRILPNSDIFNQAAFQIEIKLLPDYPFKPPEIRFITKIYHPNVTLDGKTCLNFLYDGGEYRPTTSLLSIIKRLVYLIDHPQLDHAVNDEVAAEYNLNRAEFNRKALEWVRQYGLSRD